MQTSTASNNKLTSLTSIETQLFFLATLLADQYTNNTSVEGLDADGAEVRASSVQLDVFPVVLLSGAKTFQAVARISLPIAKLQAYRAAKWEHVTVLGSETPNAAIANTTTGT